MEYCIGGTSSHADHCIVVKEHGRDKPGRVVYEDYTSDNHRHAEAYRLACKKYPGAIVSLYYRGARMETNEPISIS